MPLRLRGPRIATTPNREIVVTVINGSDRSAVGFAEVMATDGTNVVRATADSYGNARLTFTVIGAYTVRAVQGANIPSNVLRVNVT
jgi:hypothetical protein